MIYGLRPEASNMSNLPRSGLLHTLYGCGTKSRAFGCLYKDKMSVIMRRTKGRARVPHHFPQPNVSKIATVWFASVLDPSIARSEWRLKAFRRKESFPLYEQGSSNGSFLWPGSGLPACSPQVRLADVSSPPGDCLHVARYLSKFAGRAKTPKERIEC